MQQGDAQESAGNAGTFGSAATAGSTATAGDVTAVWPRRMSARGLAALVLIAALLAGAYIFVLTNYTAEGGSKVTGGLGPTDARGLIVTIEPTAIDPLKGVATMQYTFTAVGEDLVDLHQHLKQNVRILITSASGVQEVKYATGDAVGRIDGQVPIDGELALYPLDRYSSLLTVSADTFAVGTDASVATTGTVLVGMQAVGGVNGWDSSLTLPTSLTDEPLAALEFSRAFSTQVFAVVLLAMVVVLAGFALFVSILVITRRRRMEAALLGWSAALLFALPLLRTYLPNSPPIGAAIDVYIYLWVILAAVLACVFLLCAWIGQSRDALHQGQGTPRGPGHAA